MKVTRRQFLAGGLMASCVLALNKAIAHVPGSEFLSRLSGRPKSIPGSMRGASSTVGHKLRAGGFANPTRTLNTEVVIVGGGVAGLAAGYQLMRNGLSDFMLLDLEADVGGNAVSGENEVSAYPWGAHYVPLVNAETTAVRQLFQELGIITAIDAAGLPVYNEFYLCADPHERLYMHGRWQDGLVPMTGIAPEDEAQYRRFFNLMNGFKQRVGSDGKPAFAIPLDKSSQDENLLALDTITMQAWLTQNDFNSPYLIWYINYSCRDDYGMTCRDISAWAGIHYFAGRNGRVENGNTQDVVTWPEGNGFLVHKLAESMRHNIYNDALVYNVQQDKDGCSVLYWDAKKDRTIQVKARSVILATPQFITHRMLPLSSKTAYTPSYAPWAVANITLSKLPEGGKASLSWDNVVFDSKLLGYVVATHQIPQMNPLQTVLTYYWPLSDSDPATERQKALARSLSEWQNIFLDELLAIHPELSNHVERVDIGLWGHAMARPVPGLIWGSERRAVLKQAPPIFTAHADMSGLSIFEEAYTHGVQAAENVLSFFNKPFNSVL